MKKHQVNINSKASLSLLRSMSSRRWLVGAYIIMLLILTAMLTYEHRHNTEWAVQYSENLVGVLEARLNGKLRQVDGALQFVAGNLDLIENELAEARGASETGKILSRHLFELKTSFPVIDELFVFDATGKLKYSSLASGRPADISDRPHFQVLKKHSERDVFFSDVITARATGRQSMAHLRALRGSQGEFSGVVSALVSVEAFSQSLAAVDAGPGGVVLLRRKDTSVLIARQPRLNETDFNQPLPEDNPIRQRIAAGERQGVIAYTASTDGVKRIASFKVFEEYPFYVQVSLARDHYLQAWRQLLWFAIVVAGLLSGGFLLIYRQLRTGEAAQQAAQEALQQSNRKLSDFNRDVEAFLESTTDFVYFKDAQRRIRFCSQAMARITGHVSWQEMIGKHDREIFPPDTAKIYEEEENPVFEKGTALLNKVNPYYDEQGNLGYVQTNKWPLLDTGGQVVGLFGISRDITAHKRAEEALCQQGIMLARSNTELEQFAYVASHDLRQPLRMINSYLQLLDRKLADTLDDDTRKMMEFAVDGAVRMDQMLQSLLEYSRVGRSGEPMTLLDSRLAVDEALHFLSPAITEAGASIEIEGTWPQVYAARNEFTRLLQNLISNALKFYAPEQPPLVSIESEITEDGWQFCVRDNGIGIDPEQQDRLFKVFQRLHTSDQYQGTGIGLAVARKIVERHGGHIRVESEGIGKGSCFCFVLPSQHKIRNSL